MMITMKIKNKMLNSKKRKKRKKRNEIYIFIYIHISNYKNINFYILFQTTFNKLYIFIKKKNS